MDEHIRVKKRYTPINLLEAALSVHSANSLAVIPGVTSPVILSNSSASAHAGVGWMLDVLAPLRSTLGGGVQNR